MPLKKPTLNVIAGPNGSGKTTLTNILLAHKWLSDSEYINADNIAQQEFGDWNSPEAVLKAAQKADALREQCMADKKNFAFETVFSSPGRYDQVCRAKAAGYFVRLYFIATNNPEINISRVARRVEAGGHNVPTDKIIQRYYGSIENLKKILPQIDRGYVIDNSIDNAKYQNLFRTVDGQIVRQYQEPLPQWAEEVAQSLEGDMPFEPE